MCKPRSGGSCILTIPTDRSVASSVRKTGLASELLHVYGGGSWEAHLLSPCMLKIWVGGYRRRDHLHVALLGNLGQSSQQDVNALLLL